MNATERLRLKYDPKKQVSQQANAGVIKPKSIALKLTTSPGSKMSAQTDKVRAGGSRLAQPTALAPTVTTSKREKPLFCT